VFEDVNKKINEDRDLNKLKSLTSNELNNIFNQVTLEEIEDLMNELNGGEIDD